MATRKTDDHVGTPRFDPRAFELLLEGHDVEVFPGADERWDAKVARQREATSSVGRATEDRLRVNLLGEGGFPTRAIDAARSATRDTLAIDHARSWRKSILVFSGAVGCGKTTAAAWIALRSGGESPLFVTATRLESRGRYDRALQSAIDHASLLVVDDIGSEVLDSKGVFRSLFEDLVDHFYRHRRMLIITTNLKPKRDRPDGEAQFAERYGPRVVSRIREAGSWAECGTRDLRRDQLELGES